MESLTATPSVAEFDAPLGTESRPRWRGRSHVYAGLLAIPALAIMFGFASGTRARLGIGIYSVGLCSMFFASATYHRWVHTMRARRLWQRADHAMIYAAIAGSFTPICLLTVSDRVGVPLLVAIWAGGCFGMAMKFWDWRHQRVVGGVMYIALGWAGVVATPWIWHNAGVLPTLLVLFGGVCYTLGAIGFSRKWPRLRPDVFSYHEVWHLWTIVAAGAQLAAIWLIAT